MGTERNNNSPTRLYRDSEHGMLFGVCAGVADYFGFRRGAVRWVTVIVSMFIPMTILGYLVLAFLLPRKPREMYKDSQEEQMWRSIRAEPSMTFARVRHKYREIEARLQRVERYVTSSRFKLDRDFRDLERR
jgi:phage shock protein C